MSLGMVIDQGKARRHYFDQFPEDNRVISFNHILSSPVLLCLLALLVSLSGCSEGGDNTERMKMTPGPSHRSIRCVRRHLYTKNLHRGIQRACAASPYALSEKRTWDECRISYKLQE